MRELLEHLQAMAVLHGATLTQRGTLLPMSIEAHAVRGDLSRGVLATVAEVYSLACKSPEGRQAARDLGFEPLLERVEGE